MNNDHPTTQAPANATVDPALPESRQTPHRAARVGLWTLGIGLGGFLLWASLAPLDEGVPTHGVVTLDTKRKAVQHLTGGTVKEVLVHEGELVKQGQVLMRLDEAIARANFESVRQRYLGLRATHARLKAEETGAPTIQYHPDLQQAMADPLIKAQVQTQELLIQSRRSSLKADLQAIEENIRGQESLMASYTDMLKNRRSQLTLLQEELEHTTDLVKEGYAPRNRQLELQRMAAESNTAIAELTGNMARSSHAITEMRQRAQVKQQDYRKEVQTLLAEVTRDVQSDAEKFTAVQSDLERTEIKSPASGQVVGLSIQTIGGVIQAGQKIMDIVPEDSPLILETRIDPNLIDSIHTGLSTDIRFTAFAHSPQLVVEGQVLSVSGDLLTDPQTGISYYLARIKVTAHGMKTLGARLLQPGIPAEIIIKTGERTLLKYLLSPLLKRAASSMKEQ